MQLQNFTIHSMYVILIVGLNNFLWYCIRGD
nr:MAG TPA: hypothetical protein [Caudoviricetes sp.]DAW12075.1 MAG TPA: hypothetical protein [Caudoviricetes sp.]